jgi:hypothetical protein
MEIKAIRELLSQGETGKALAAFLDYLKRDVQFKDNFQRTLEVLEGEYNAVRQKELKGILPFQEAQREYNQINDTIFSILDDLEAGRIPAAAIRSRNRMALFAVLGVVLLVVTVFLGVWFFGKAAHPCPEFMSEKALHILVIPFDSLSTQSAPVEIQIQQSISELTEKAAIPVEVRIVTRGKNDISSLEVAKARSADCAVGLVIYGQYFAYAADSIRVKLGYIDLKQGGKTGSLPFNTFRDITEVSAMRDLQDALFWVCTMIAINDEKWDFAQRWMDKIKDKGAEENETAQWVAKKKETLESGK